MTSSVHDWETKLTEEEKKIISGTLLGFTQMELYIGNYWAQKVAAWFPKPEISLMAFTFGGMECFDWQTDMLTSDGWVPCHQITVEHQLAQFNITTYEISYEHPTEVIRRRHVGTMYHFVGDNVDVCVTPNHDMVVMAADKLIKVKAQDLELDYQALTIPSYNLSTETIEFEPLPRPFKRTYDDYVYCVSMPEATVVVRRNNKVVISGNCIHAKSYNYLNETLNLEEYDAFLREPSAAAKIENLINTPGDTLEERAISLAVYSAFAEGVSLYANFAVLLYFSARGLIRELDRANGKDLSDQYGLKGNYLELPEDNLLKGVSEIIAYSVRDECHSPDTEVLTPKGWVRFDELKDTDQVAQYDIDTGEVSFVTPSRVVRRMHKGEMIKFGGEKTPFRANVTPNHDMIQRWDKQNRYSKTKAKDLKLMPNKLIPVSGYKTDGSWVNLSDLDRFNIAIQADGNMPKRYTGARCGTIPVKFSLTKDRKIKRMESLLEKLGFSHKTKSEDGEVKFSIDVPVELAVFKTFEEWVDLSKVTSQWASEFIQELQYWDGYNSKDNNYIYYSSVIPSNVDIVQSLCALSGHQATYAVQVDKRKESYRDVHRLYIHDNDYKRTARITKDTYYYEGMVYCATVPTGALVTRYEKAVGVTGNCVHSSAGCWLFRTLRSEYPELHTQKVNDILYEAARTVVRLEYDFIDTVFDNHELPGLNAHIVKSFIEQRTNQKLDELGLRPIFEPDRDAARQIERWFYLMTGGEASTDFFAAHVSNYAKGLFDPDAIDWDQVFATPTTAAAGPGGRPLG